MSDKGPEESTEKIQLAAVDLWKTGEARRQLWERDLIEICKDPSQLEGNAQQLGALILKTLQAYTDPISRNLVEALLCEALMNETFLKTFAGLLVKHGANTRSPRDCAQLARWTFLVLEKLDTAAGAKAIPKLMEIAAGCLNSLLSKSQWKGVTRKFSKLVRGKGIVSEAVNVAKQTGSTGLIRALLDLDCSVVGEFEASIRPVALSLYCDQVLGSKSRVGADVLWGYAPLVASLKHDECETIVVPSAGKSVRRNPEVALTVLHKLLSDINLDMSRHSGQLLTPLLQFVRHVKEGNRETAVKCVRQLCRHASDVDSLAAMVDIVTGILEGKTEGRVKNVYERTSLMNALSGMSSGVGQTASGLELASKVASFCCSYFGTEVNEDVKVNTLEALGNWWFKSSSTPDSILELLPKALAGKDSLRRGALNALVHALENSELRNQVGSLASSLTRVIVPGLTKVAQRADGIVALLAVAWISAVDHAADDELKKEKTWKAVLTADSPYFSTTTAAKLSPEDSCHLAKLVQCLLSMHVDKLNAVDGMTETLCSILVLLLLHYSKDVRRAASIATSRCLGSSPVLAKSLLDALRGWLVEGKQTPGLQAAGEDDGIPSSAMVAKRFADAVNTIMPIGVDGSVVISAHTLLKSHHPQIMNGAKRSWAWGRLKSHHEDLVTILAGNAGVACGIMCGEQGLASKDMKEVASAISAISCIMREAPDVFFDPLLKCLEEFLNQEKHDELSEHQLMIFSVPEGILSSELHNMQIIIPELDKKKAKTREKKARGRFRGDRVAFAEESDTDSDDDSSAKPSRGPAARPSQMQSNGGQKGKGSGGRAGGKGAKDGSERQAEMRLRQLEEESQIREEVRAVKQQLENGLLALVAITQGNHKYCGERLDELMHLMPLLRSPLVGEGPAFEYAVGLASCLPGELAASCLTVACALRLVMLSEDGSHELTSKQLLEHHSLKSTLDAMVAVTGRKKSLPVPAYFFVFPAIRAILGASALSPLHDDALKILSLHVTPGERLPREESFKLLYHILMTIPTYRNEVQPCLSELCAGAIDSEIISAMQGLLMASPMVRGGALQALTAVPSFAAGVCPDDDELLAILMIALHDPNEANEKAGKDLWQMAGAHIPATFVRTVSPYLSSSQADLRQAATKALVEGLQNFIDSSGEVLERCIAVFSESGGVSERLGAAEALGACAEFFDADGVHTALDFLLQYGFCDEDVAVREKLVAAGVQLVDKHGKYQIQQLYGLLQSHLEKPPASTAKEEARQDKVREGAVLLLATMAKLLSPEDPKVKDIIKRLIAILSTPSEAVQKAAAGCLSPLMQMLQSDREYNESVIKQLKMQLTKGSSYGDRRGAAFGLAGVVKGLGISVLKGYGVMDALKGFIEDKSDPKIREGAVQAFECLCDHLGKLFEPYVINILPLILTCFGDTANHVREATVDAARAIMRNLSAQGVKLVLPSLLEGLSDQVWRTKQGSIQLLGAMAWCAPKQLSTCLPTIVPKLSEVLSDPHQKVQKAAQLALDEVGNTIRNPEVQELVPSLLNAIAQPNKFTRDCLDQLLETVFVNTIDAPSLALIIPVVFRGLKDRSGEVKKRAARIVQNLCKLVNDPKDMAPYVNLLTPELQKAIVDPLPDVRAQSSKALGALMGDMGKDSLQDVMPWLIETLKSKGSSVERSGAAQALAEVLAVYGTNYFETLLPQFLDDCRATVAAVREGGIILFRFLPYTMRETFQSHLDEVLPCILDGLADENEGVRNASMSAGKTLVDVYAETSLVLILPAVELGLCNDNWRIRNSSVELLGSLFYKVAGTSGKIQMDGDSDDEGVAVESYSTAIIAALGHERRNEVLAKLYMTRADVQYPVRSAALHVWKTVVVNTPKTLGEILPKLMEHAIDTLAHSGDDGRETAGRCIGELVKKMGERVLPTILPILKEGTESENPQTRQGVCYGLSEVLDSLTRAQLADHLPMLLPAIQATLCDEDALVREAAAGAFNALFKAGAGGIVDTVVPALLSQLQSDRDNSKALEGLQVILSVRPQTLNSMVPRLLHKPLTATNLSALGAVAAAAGASLQNHLSTILPPVLTIASMQTGKHIVEVAQEAARKVALSVPEEAISVLVTELVKALEDTDKGLCAAELIRILCTDAKSDLSEHTTELLQSLIPLLATDDEAIVKACWAALAAVTSTIPKEMLSSYVRCLRDSVAGARDTERRKMTGGPLLVAGFCLPKGLSPILPIYLQGVLQGDSAEIRELAAEGLGELVVLTSPQMLRPFIVQITGPLIRIIGDRFPWQVKFAILNTLGMLINKAGDGLKAFVPQLQTTFLKCLQDPTQGVRDQAAKNLGQLTRMSSRVDQLAADLCNHATKGDSALQRSYLAALRGIFQSSGDRISPDVFARTGHDIKGMLSSLGEDENDIVAAASCLGVFCIHCGPEDMKSTLSRAWESTQSKWNLRLAHAVVVATVARFAHGRLRDLELSKDFVSAIIKFSKDDKIPVKIAACKAAARFIVAEVEEEKAEWLGLTMPAIITCLAPDQNSDLQREGLAALRRICYLNPVTLQAYFPDILPSLCSLVNVGTGPTKTQSERTLALVLNLVEEGDAARAYLASNPGGTVKSVLTESFLRRLQKMSPDTDEDEEAY